MKSKRNLLRESRFYIIIDKKVCGRRSVLAAAGIIKDSGVDIIQFRDKDSPKKYILENTYALRKLLSGTKTIFIVNDYLDIAKIADSDGVHLGASDTSIEIARKILGKDKIIGVSCHNLSQAITAQKKGADYISIGPIFPTATKPEYGPIGLDLIEEVNKKIKVPFFVIGGINQNNIKQVLSCGATRVAVCRAICQAKNISFTTRHFSCILH